MNYTISLHHLAPDASESQPLPEVTQATKGQLEEAMARVLTAKHTPSASVPQTYLIVAQLVLVSELLAQPLLLSHVRRLQGRSNQKQSLT